MWRDFPACFSARARSAGPRGWPPAGDRRGRKPVSGAPPGHMMHNPVMRADAAESPDDPLEQDAPDQVADDPAITWWFLGEGDRANPATDLRAFTTGNLVQPLIDGHSYFARLHA